MTAKVGRTEKSGWPSYRYLRSAVSVWVRLQPTGGGGGGGGGGGEGGREEGGEWGGIEKALVI